ncbi:MAG: YbfB/YjiJ family MFS transporter, partial [Pseudomonadota bacterium]
MMPRLADWQRIGIGCGAAMFLCMALGRFSYSTMIPALVEQGLMTAIVAGYIGGANLVGHLVGALLSVTVAQRGELRRLMAIAVWIAVIALIGSAINLGPVWLGFWRFVIGVMTGFVMVQSLALMTLHAPDDRRPQAASYVFVGVGCGILFSGTAVPMLLRLGLAEAWWGVALAGALAAAVSQWALVILAPSPQQVSREAAKPPRTMAWRALVAASFLFSVGLVPHTIYWFDYIARWLGQGYAIAGAHWVAIGFFGILGPILVAALARGVGTAIATTAIYFVLAFGVAAPAFATDYALIIASTVIFGIQPGVSTMIAARARDLGSAAQTPAMMRTTIVGNGIGAAVGGILIPGMLDATGSYALLFLFGGLSFFIGGLLCLPFLRTKLAT